MTKKNKLVQMKRTTLSLDIDLMNRLQLLCVAEDRTMSWLVRRGLTESIFLKELEEKNKKFIEEYNTFKNK